MEITIITLVLFTILTLVSFTLKKRTFSKMKKRRKEKDLNRDYLERKGFTNPKQIINPPKFKYIAR